MSGWSTEILVVGGGAAGMMAAGTAAEAGRRVTLLEHSERLGKKLYITGKGRCNLCNRCTPEEVLQNLPRNSRFLHSAVRAFPPEAVCAFFEGLGCPLKTERGRRVFPVSDRSASVLDALRGWLKRTGVRVERAEARSLLLGDGALRGLHSDRGDWTAAQVILCTGGLSYPKTGSTGDGYRLAAEAGHTIVPPRGSLVPLEVPDGLCAGLDGLTLRNVGLRLLCGGKCVYRDFGELSFTDFGLAGPTILSASAHLEPGRAYDVVIDLKPALDEKKLDERLLRDFTKDRNRPFDEALSELLPRQLIPTVVRRSGIPPRTPLNSVTREQRRALRELLKGLSFPISGPRPVEEAIVTAGGVRVSEVDPRTMESRLLPGLYLAGELLDVDGYTGGFNLQIAWSTGRAAGLAAARAAENLTYGGVER